MKSIIKKYLANRNKTYLLAIPPGLVILNFIVQRIFKINSTASNSIHYTSRVDGFSNIIFPKDCRSIQLSFAVSGGCYFSISPNTTFTIGKNSIWAFNVCIQTGNHGLINRSEYEYKSIKIGDNCWLGNSVTILAGVELGDNVTVGANSVVTKSFPSNCVIAGCPAKIIKQL